MFKLTMTHNAFLKLKYYTKGTNLEISGFGKVREVIYEEEIEDDDITCKGLKETTIEETTGLEIYDFEIFPQKVSAASSDLDEEEMAKALVKKIRNNEKVEDIKVWWHSHADMGVFFSATDINTINNSSEFPYLISLVTNHEHKIEARLDVFKPFRFTLENVEIEIDEPEDEKLEKKINKEIEAKVKETSLLDGDYTSNYLKNHGK